MSNIDATLRLAALFILGCYISLHASIAHAEAEGTQWMVSGSLFGKPMHDASVSHLPHANPKAPKGGTLNLATRGSYDSFNPFVVRGRAPAGLTYFGGLLYDGLFAQAVDQPSTSYPMIADRYRHATDYSWATYHLNPSAKFHDGHPINPEDVIWSAQTLPKAHPLWRQYYKNIKSIKVTGDREVTFYFDQKNNRELPLILGDLPVLPKHWWTGKDADGNSRDITKPTKEPPLGSGAYRIGSYKFGKSITWERVKDYWAKDLIMNKGRYNFDQIHYSYFLDDTAIWEGFKKGGIIDFRRENRSQRWAKSYNFPAIKKGEVIKRIFKETGPQSYQGYFINTRLEKFKSRKVRKALNLLFDFETMNKKLFYGFYTRTDSPFEGGELESKGVPQGRELEILLPYKDKLPAELFKQPFQLAKYEKPGSFRRGQRAALSLFKQAGYRFENGKMLNPQGQQMKIEFLGNNPTDQRIAGPFIANLKRLGIDARLVIVDNAQYQNRVNDFNFEITSLVTAQSLSPGNEQREYWSSKAADIPGSRNYSGIKNPVVDDLVERIIASPNRGELVALTHALDRFLKWEYYTVPHWHNPQIWAAYWKKLKFLDKQPTYRGVDIYSFWIDPSQK